MSYRVGGPIRCSQCPRTEIAWVDATAANTIGASTSSVINLFANNVAIA
jgi:hypothetical protein